MYDNPACRDEDPELFFPGRARGGTAQYRDYTWALQVATAKAVCGRCPHITECLEDNLRVPTGIYGGTTEAERHEMRKQLGIKARNMSPLPNDATVLAQRARRERERQAAMTEDEAAA